jgi:hypothetical protein
MKMGVLLVASFFLIGFVGAISLTGSTIDNSTHDEHQAGTDNPQNDNHHKLDASQIKEIVKEKNKLKFENKTGAECPESCTCTGSVVKCEFANGTREMTITAGKSGNTIIQIEGENMSTKVTLYKSGDRVYGIFKNNETKVVRMLPNQVKEKLREKTAKFLENENITLDENGTYQYEGKKKSKLFFFIPIKIGVKAEIDAETGEIIKMSKPNWWEFLTKDEANQIVGASCGTVTPGYNDKCCQTKGYDAWNNETGECIFNS